MRKLLAFILLVLCFIGIVGGIGYSIYCHAYLIAVGILVAGFLAWVEFKEMYEILTG